MILNLKTSPYPEEKRSTIEGTRKEGRRFGFGRFQFGSLEGHSQRSVVMMALQPAIRLGGSFQSPGVLEQQQAHNEKQGEQDDQGREWRHQQKWTGQRFRNQIGPVSHVAHGPAHSRIRNLFQER